jgi:hypothetical protein
VAYADGDLASIHHAGAGGVDCFGCEAQAETSSSIGPSRISMSERHTPPTATGSRGPIVLLENRRPTVAGMTASLPNCCRR